VRRALVPLVASVASVGFLFVAVVPTRTWLAQRQAIRSAEVGLQVLSEQNRELTSRAAELRTDAEIERLAREQYNLVRPGEEAYAILPAAGAPPPPPAPPTPSSDRGSSWWTRAWNRLAAIF
jgi:cell division protein FtsB